MRFALRAASHADYDFAWSLFRATMRPSIEAVWGGWDEPRWEGFFRGHFDPSQTRVVVVDGQDAGILRVEDRAGEVWLDTVEIAPDHQGRGLGSAIVRAVVADAWRRNLPVGLQVNRANRARRLYERLGFVEVASTDTHYLLRADPPASPEEPRP